MEYVILLVALLIGAKYILGTNDTKTGKEKEMERMLEDMANKMRAQEEEIKRIQKGDPVNRKSSDNGQQVRFAAEDKTQAAKPKRAFRKVSGGNRRKPSKVSHLMINETSRDEANEVLVAQAKRRILKRDTEPITKGMLAQTVNDRVQKAKMTNFAHAEAISKRKKSKSVQDKKDILKALGDWEQTRDIALLDQIKLADYFDEIEYPKGAVIIKQGNLADYAFIIKSGKVNQHNKSVHANRSEKGAVAKPDFRKAQSDATSTNSAERSKFFKKAGKKKKYGKSQIGRPASQIVTNAAPPKLEEFQSDSALPEVIEDSRSPMDSVHESDIAELTIAGADIEQTYGPRKKTLGAGDLFGGIAMVFDCRRENSFIALMPCKVWRISRLEFRHVIKGEHKAEKKLPHSDIVEVLHKIELFSLFGEDVLEEIAKNFTTKKFKGGERIIKKYDVGDAFYIVKKGSIIVSDIGLGDAQIANVTGTPGFWFGEGALLTGDKRAADVHAGDEGVEVLEMTRTVFESRLGPMQEMFEKARLRRHMSAMPIFCNSNLTEKELSALADSFEEKIFKAKHIIARPKKKTPSAIYIVNYGEVYVANEKTNTVNRLVGHGHFGTRTLQRSTGDTYTSERTIKVEIETKCWVLSRAALIKVIGSMSRLGAAKSFLSENLDRTIKLDDIKRMNLFGEGSFGKVWFSKHKKKDAVYALKAMSKAQLSKEPKVVVMVKREKNLMASVAHPLIGKLIATMQDTTNLYMLMKFYSGGELQSVLERYEDGVPNASTQFYMACVAEALGHLQSRMICHRDLKPENIVMDQDGYCVLVDFGFAKVVQDGWTYTTAYTPGYIAPEMINETGHNWSVDLWALGIMIYEMLVGQNPFETDDEDDSGEAMMKKILRGEIFFPEMELDGIEVSADAQDLITRLLDRDVSKRLEFGEKMMRNHPWFNGLLQGTKLLDKKVKAPWAPDITSSQDTSNFACMEQREALLKDYEEGAGATSDQDFDDSLFADF